MLSIFSGCSQKNEFEKELNQFRFSLNSELEKYDDEKIYKFNFDKNDSVTLLIDDFFAKNKHKIKLYKEAVLEKHQNNADFTLDISNYEKVDVSEINHGLKSLDLSKNMPLSNLLWVNPLSEVAALKNVYFSREKGVANFAVFNAKNSITSSLIKTQKIGDEQWQIIDNSYDIVGKFIYDLNQGRVIKMEILERKVKHENS